MKTGSFSSERDCKMIFKIKSGFLTMSDILITFDFFRRCLREFCVAGLQAVYTLVGRRRTVVVVDQLLEFCRDIDDFFFGGVFQIREDFCFDDAFAFSDQNFLNKMEIMKLLVSICMTIKTKYMSY